jgi:2-octaprenyl-6-methoxyphenol hydroxylase
MSRAAAQAAEHPVDCDVAIVGGGMVGASLALALAGTGRSVALIEAVAVQSGAQPSFDERTTALGNGARRIFETLGVWQAIAAQAAPIRHIHISDAGHFGFARLEASAHGLPAFGFTVSNRHLGGVLWHALHAHPHLRTYSPARVGHVQLSSDAALLDIEALVPAEDTAAGAVASAVPRQLRARLAVAADGAHSLVKEAAQIGSSTRDYAQVALVANLRSERPAAGVAYERFTVEGPLALLPRHDGSYAVVWALAPAAANSLLALGDEEFRERLQLRFGWRVGRILQIGRRASYPLSLIQAHASIGQRTALIGNAAQALHPVAAQGFNLGLRDAAVLAELIAAAEDPGAAAVLAEYARQRSADRRGMIGFTDRLVRLFCDERPMVAAARDLGLLLFDLSPTAKQALSRLSWGFGRLPRLSRGLPLAGQSTPTPPP